jgi:hypothetical protein
MKKVMEAHCGTVEEYRGVVETHCRTVGAHCGTVEDYRGVVETHCTVVL